MWDARNGSAKRLFNHLSQRTLQSARRGGGGGARRTLERSTGNAHRVMHCATLILAASVTPLGIGRCLDDGVRRHPPLNRRRQRSHSH